MMPPVCSSLSIGSDIDTVINDIVVQDNVVIADLYASAIIVQQDDVDDDGDYHQDLCPDYNEG